MNDDNNKTGLPGEEALESEKLNEELENLRDTFQEKYDETVNEANELPVIQELEEGAEEEEPEEEDENEEKSQASEKPRKQKKNRKGLKIAIISVVAVLLVSVIGILVTALAVVVSDPDIIQCFDLYAKASSAETYEEKTELYEEAISLSKDSDSMFMKALNVMLLEETVVLTYENDGFAAAYSYMKANMTDDMTANPASAQFKKFLKKVDTVNDIAIKSLAVTFDNTAGVSEIPADDVLTKGLDIPEELKEDITEILSSLASACIYNASADGIVDVLTAVNYYGNAYSGFVSLGADSRLLAETYCTTLYSKGYITEAYVLASVAVDPTTENVTEEYAAMMKDAEAFSALEVSAYDMALEAIENEKIAETDIKAEVLAKTELSEQFADVFADVVIYAVETIKAENEHNLTEASTCYATLSSVLEALGITDVSVYLRTAYIIFMTGNLSEPATLIETYVTDEAMAEATEEEKLLLEDLNAVFAALEATSEIFSPYYAQYYQAGTAIDYDALSKEFDEFLSKEDATAYDRAMVNYCLYFAASTDADSTVDKLALIRAIEENMPQYPFVYGYYYLETYINNNNFTAARNYAETLLEINIADEYVNSVIALTERANGNIDASLEAALKGIEYAGSSAMCSKQAGIAYLLKGDYESATGYLMSYYSANMSLDACDLILIVEHLYEGSDEETKSTLETAVSEINQTYAYYGVSSLSETKAIIDGEKTVADIFTKGDYDLSAD
ncbi:MAG: hypothetical protein E7573_08580 [Ruminococcaceae bacterium]|nr:hypothetical protein [Oscillospiraceae bacterium]